MKKGKNKIWIIGVLVLIIFIMIFARGTSKEEEEKKDNNKNTKVEETQETQETQTEKFRVSSLDDIPQNVIDKALTYTNDDLEARLNDYNDGFSSEVTLARMVEIGTEKEKDGIYKELYNQVFTYGLSKDTIDNTSFELQDVVLCLPKNEDNKTGLLDFIYKVNVDISTNYNDRHDDYKGTFYIYYGYNINLENEELIVVDYNDYFSGGGNCIDTDFENFYNRNFVTIKDEYQLIKKGE